MIDKPSAFLLMPFDEKFDKVYTRFIKPVLEDAGFNVNRADDIQSQQSILKDILERIRASDLIVADLTGANPNVFYELGLAHALRKPVILITQTIAKVPFDVNSYRILQYGTYFVDMDEAKKELNQYAKGFLDGTIQFGSPYTDFYQEEAVQDRAENNTRSNTTDEGDRGFLDHLIDLTDGYNHIAEVIAGITSDLSDLTQSLGKSAAELTELYTNPNASSPKAAQNIVRRLAVRIADFSSRLNKANTEYANIAQDIEDSPEFMVSFQLEQSEATDSKVVEQIDSLRLLKSNAIEARPHTSAWQQVWTRYLGWNVRSIVK